MMNTEIDHIARASKRIAEMRDNYVRYASTDYEGRHARGVVTGLALALDALYVWSDGQYGEKYQAPPV